MDRTGDSRNSIGVVLVGHPELSAVGPEAARHYSCTFNAAGLPVMRVEPDIGDSCQSVAVVQAAVAVHLPDAAAISTRHDHVEVKSAPRDLVERDPGMVLSAASVWNGRKQRGGKGWPQLPDVGACCDKIVARGERHRYGTGGHR